MKQLWTWLDGKKTNMGAALLLLWEGWQLAFPNLISDRWEEWIGGIIALITGVGLGHKGIKSLKTK